MTDTGQIPGEGLPENGVGEAGLPPHTGLDGNGVPQQAGWGTGPGAPGTAYAYVDQPTAGPGLDDEDDGLLMPGPQGAWTESPSGPAQAEPQPYAGQGHLASGPAHLAPEHQDPSRLVPQHLDQPQLLHAQPQHPVQARVEPSPVLPPAASVVNVISVEVPTEVPVETSHPQAPPAAPRRPLHMGPPVADTPSGGVSVRSLADRGPAVTTSGPPTSGPEYLDVPRDEAIPAQQTGEPSGTDWPPAGGGPSLVSLIPHADSVIPAQASAPAVSEGQGIAAPAAQPPADEPASAASPEPPARPGLAAHPESAVPPAAPAPAFVPAPAPADGPQFAAPAGEPGQPGGAAFQQVAAGPDAAGDSTPAGQGGEAALGPGAPEAAGPVAVPSPAPEQQPAPAAEAAAGPAEPAATPAPAAAVPPVPQAPGAARTGGPDDAEDAPEQPVGPVLQAAPAAEQIPAPAAPQAAAEAAVVPGVLQPVPQPTQEQPAPEVGEGSAAVADANAVTGQPDSAAAEAAAAGAGPETPDVADVGGAAAGADAHAGVEAADADPVTASPAGEQATAVPAAVVEAAPGAGPTAQPEPEADAQTAPAGSPEPGQEEPPAPARAGTGRRRGPAKDEQPSVLPDGDAAGQDAAAEPVTAAAPPPAEAVAAAGEAATPAAAPSRGRRGRRAAAPAAPAVAAEPVDTAETAGPAGPGETPVDAAVVEVPAARPPATGDQAAEDSGKAAAASAEEPAGPAPAADDQPAAARPQAAGQPPAAEPYDSAVRDAVHRVIRERRDIRNGFRPDPIPHEVLLRVLEAAHTAPSVGHSQPWDFVVIRSEKTRERMHALAMQQREAYAKSLPKARARQFRELKIEAILDTPVNIVVTADPTRGGRHTLGRHTQPQMAPYSSALAVENLWLAARAEGLGVGWVSFFDERQMVEELGLPEHLEVVAYLCVGYVDEFPEEPELMQAGWSQRRPLSWVVHEEEYGNRALPGEEPHDLLEETLRGIRPLDAKALGEAWERQKRMTKPAGALGMLEIISAQLSGLSRQCPPPIPEPAAVAVFAGDHGVHAQGVTAWPQEVTGQMVANFLGGGAVCNAFANQVGAEVCVIDVGVASELPSTPGLLPRKVRPGTADFTAGPAMTREEALRAVGVGIETARDLVAAGNKALLTGEMGIANTTASAALIAVFTGVDAAEVTGRGTGINDEMHARKIEVVRRALELHRPDPADPIAVLAAVGGLEHAAMVGLLLGAAALRTPVILDGVSAGAAALVARAIAPEVLAACIAGHRSAEPGHMAALTTLGLRPLVDLDLRLGEGTGALLALPLVQSAARVMHEVATFDAAGVTEKG